MSFRLISLFITPPAKGLGFTHFHSAALDQGTLKLREPATTDHYPAEALPLKVLTDNAMRREWAKKVGDYAAQLDNAMEQTKGKQHKGRRADSKSLPELLIEKGPWIAPSLDNKNAQSSFPKSAIGLLRNLKDDGKAILERKTIFLVPCFLPDLKQEMKHVPAITRAIAYELKIQLDDLASTPTFGFLKFASAKRPDGRADEPGIMSEIVRRLLIETSALTLDKAKGLQQYDKEGPLLMDGPTGTGKSMSAELIALQQGKAITKVNIAATTESLLESRMRGYLKGAFTGANEDKDGWFAEANGGILFLDEFQNASLSSQTQLLDLLDPVSNEVYISRIGEEAKPGRYNVKVILAVNKPIDELLSSGKLREDLYYRIRDVIKLSPMNKLLETGTPTTPERVKRLIRGLVYLYRWKSAPTLAIQNEGTDSGTPFSSESGCVSLFPSLDEMAITELQRFDWKGNFRQFERVICDIHWENDRDNRSVIDAAIILRLLEGERTRLGKASPTTPKEGLDRVTSDRIATVESLLQANNFNIKQTVEDLKQQQIFGLGSRQSLYRFLHKNVEHLKPEIKRDSKLVDFMDLKKSPIDSSEVASEGI